MRTRAPGLLLAALLVAPLTGCEEGDAVSLQLTLSADGGGRVSLCRLTIPQSATDAEGMTSGVTWQHRAQLTCSSGRFGDIGQLSLADLGFSHGVDEDGHAHLRVELPRGRAATWPELLTVAASGQRRSALSALDPTGRMNEVGDSLRIEIRTPEDVGTHGVKGGPPEVISDASGAEASLVVPLEVVLEEGEPLVWTLTWEGP